MTAGNPFDAPVANPETAWAALEAQPDALLVDVRTRAEWSFVGVPELGGIGGETVLIEWRSYPSMVPNPDFLPMLSRAVDDRGARTVFFICRSGARSHDAAVAAAAHFAASGRRVACVNVLEGFEGDLDGEGHRGRLGGWKARGLPWRQS
jgi:rhodanese-related sulfurtransferase